jgi:uncharacterized protein YbjQ (UPF0145 family)
MTPKIENKTSVKSGDKQAFDGIPSCFVDTHGVITSTMNEIPGYRVVKVLGTIYGITVQSRNWGLDIGTFLRSTIGGELKVLTTLMYRSRNCAQERLIGECLARGGNAIIAMRFDQGEVSCIPGFSDLISGNGWDESS